MNPPGSIYYNEAERIESWALEHITKAAGTVIEYETDWNIDVQRDYDPEDEEKGEGRVGEGEKRRKGEEEKERSWENECSCCSG